MTAQFDGGRITSDGGGLLLREVEQRTGILRQFAGCFTDHRNPELIEHTREQLIAQRVYGLALGYEDLNDHERLRHDPLLAVMIGRDDDELPAGKSTLNRLELTPAGAGERSRYKKIVADCEAIDRLLPKLFIDAHDEPPARIVLDFDATDDPIHGDQLGKFFHGYYDCHCYLPLYVTCGEHVLAAKLRPSNIDESAGALTILQRLVAQIREAWPQTRIVMRGDGGFCREPIMRWCEDHGVDYILGLPKNQRLLKMLCGQMIEAKRLFEQTSQASRIFGDLRYQTRKTWRNPRRVVGKAEHLSKGPNPRFVVTSISAEELEAQTLYEQHYCPRGEMENRIKEQQLDLFADRTSSHTMRANQVRLYFSTIAYTLLAALRRLGLRGTEMAKARCSTIRVKLLKIGARIRITARRVWVSLSEAYPMQALFAAIHQRLTRAGPSPA